MKNILVPTDFSKFAISATKTAAYLANKTGATVHLLNICQAPEDWDQLTVDQQQRYPEIEGRIVEAEIKIQKLAEDPVLKGVSTYTAVTGGTPYKQIIEYADYHKIDLIVMGAHGHNESDGPFIGSTAQKIIRMAPCLVLSVKKNFKPSSLKKIVFASDFEETKAKGRFQAIKNFALATKAHIDFAFINTPAHFETSQAIDDKLKAFHKVHHEIKPNYFVHNDLTTEKGIINVSHRVKANMIALVTHNRHGKKNYLLGVTETVTLHSDIPVLSIVL